jgi:hypothetical protein
MQRGEWSMSIAIPVRKLKNGRLSINLIAARKAIDRGTLSAEDRDTIERLLPGVLDRDMSKIMNLGRGNSSAPPIFPEN